MTRLTQAIRAVGSDWKTRGQLEVYPFPDDWAIKEYRLRDAPRLRSGRIREALSAQFPFQGGTATLRALAKGKRRAAVLIDDLSRPTPAYELAPHLVNELIEAGVPGDQIRFILAVGTHRPLTKEEMELKLGAEIVAAFACENHDAFRDDLVDLGTTTRGTRVRVNRAVAEADLVIGLGLLSQHAFAYGGGGSKIILPGVCHKDTTQHNHTSLRTEPEGKYGAARLDMNEAATLLARQVALVVINTVVNRLGHLTDVFLGDSVSVFEGNIDQALRAYELDFTRGDYGDSGKADLGFFRLGLHSSDPSQLWRGCAGWEPVCDVPILISDCSDRYYYHGLPHGPYEEFLAKARAAPSLPNPPIEAALEGKGRIVFSPHLDPVSAHITSPGWHVTDDWPQLMRELHEALGADRTVAFFHDASLQILRLV